MGSESPLSEPPSRSCFNPTGFFTAPLLDHAQPTGSPLHPVVGQHHLSMLGLGFAALGRPGCINLGHGEDARIDRSLKAMRERAFAVLDAAWRDGIRYLDTARSYGHGEAFLGDWLRSREVLADAVTIASKWGYTDTAD